MTSKAFVWTIHISMVMALAAGAGALAQTPRHITFRGTINDYTPASNVAGPWEVRGHWSLTVKGGSGRADFSAALTMERSDAGVVENSTDNSSNPLDNPTIRNAHTHHITLLDGEVTPIPNGFEVTGPATITVNGSFPPPFGSALPMLTIDITGGNTVGLSNITVLFGAPAAGHFGSLPLHGVLRTPGNENAAER